MLLTLKFAAGSYRDITTAVWNIPGAVEHEAKKNRSAEDRHASQRTIKHRPSHLRAFYLHAQPVWSI